MRTSLVDDSTLGYRVNTVTMEMHCLREQVASIDLHLQRIDLAALCDRKDLDGKTTLLLLYPGQRLLANIC